MLTVCLSICLRSFEESDHVALVLRVVKFNCGSEAFKEFQVHFVHYGQENCVFNMNFLIHVLHTFSEGLVLIFNCRVLDLAGSRFRVSVRIDDRIVMRIILTDFYPIKVT